MTEFEKIMAPVWSSEIIYDEFLMMHEVGGKTEAPLLFEPEYVISVTSADKTETYEQGRDWTVRGNILTLTSDSRIFRFTEDEMIFDDKRYGKCFRTRDGRYSLFSEGHFFHDRQIAVTYKRKPSEPIFTPEFVGDRLPRTMELLEAGKPLRLLVFGDSISCGCNSSSFSGVPPYVPKWDQLLCMGLWQKYGAAVELKNTACGGQNSRWALENAKALVGEQYADLAIIAFGMNDRIPEDEFCSNIEKTMEEARSICPHTEFLLCATSFPNPILEGFMAYQDKYYAALKTIEGEGVAVISFGEMQNALMKTKRYEDLCGNNVNHPNDFFACCHAQLVKAALSK
jgi:lysophospholipase L1-like esterase